MEQNTDHSNVWEREETIYCSAFTRVYGIFVYYNSMALEAFSPADILENI